MAEYSYGAFGDLRDTSGSLVQRYGYLSRPDNPATRLHNFNARSYSAGDGRFISPDPVMGFLTLPQTLNPYAYGVANPYKWPDPSGRSILEDVGGWAEGAASDVGGVASDAWGAAKDAPAVMGEGSLQVCSYVDGGCSHYLEHRNDKVPPSFWDSMSQHGWGDRALFFVPGVGWVAKGAKATSKASGRLIGEYGAITGKRAGHEAHHILQDAAMRNVPGYSKRKAPAISLKGRASQKGTEHHLATQTQRKISLGGNLSAEREVAYQALRAAGLNKREVKQALDAADEYASKLGLHSDSITRIPGNRKVR